MEMSGNFEKLEILFEKSGSFKYKLYTFVQRLDLENNGIYYGKKESGRWAKMVFKCI